MAAKSTSSVGDHVCVIGAGALGLTAIKNLMEQGLKVTAFERNDRLGGNWDVSGKKDQVTALDWTSANLSKQTSCFSDFPYSKDAALHPTAKEIGDYLSSYAHHFDLVPHIRFSTKVIGVERDDAAGKWVISTRNVASLSQETYTFDRLVVATGILNTKNQVSISGIERFKGEVVHSREFKDPYQYTGKNVLVVGIGATGSDTTSFLKRAGAANIYLSHRSQTYLLPKVIDGKAFDHSMSYRLMHIARFCLSLSPWGMLGMMAKGMRSAQFKASPWLAKHASFSSPRSPPGAPMVHCVPVFSADLADNLRDGSVKGVVGVEQISGPKSVTLTDGTVIDDLDAIIVCSGYHYDFSLVSGAGNPVDPDKAPDHYERIQATPHFEQDSPFPRLYQGFISEQYPESLAFLGHFLIMGSPFMVYDIVTMALARLWSGAVPLPSVPVMRKDIDAHYDFVVQAMKIGRVPHPGFRVNGLGTFQWLNEAAGTGVTDQLCHFYPAAWKLWWNDRQLYNMLMDGLHVPAIYRLLDTGNGRKPWSGARAHIEAMNKEVKDMGEAWKKQEKLDHH